MFKKKNNSSDVDIKIKEFGVPIFKAKGSKSKIKKEVDSFFKLKF